MKLEGFVGPSYTLRSVNVECQRCVNLYPEVDEAGTQKDHGVMALIGTPGVSAPLLTLPTSPIRASYVSTKNDNYVVAGNTLYDVFLSSGAWTYSTVGTINTAAGPISMKDNGVDLFLVDATTTDGFYTTLGTTVLTQTADPNWQGATQVDVADGMFIFNVPGTFEFYCSELLSTTINPLGLGSRETPDPIQGFVWDHRNLWLFGKNSTEVWFDAGVGVGGTTGNPFQIIQGGYLEVGCASGQTIQQIGNTLLWLGMDPRGQACVYMTNGYQPARVSTHAVELAVQGYGDLSGATAWTYGENGHNFYLLNCPGADTTWCYDLTTNLWHERAYLNNGVFERHIAQCYSFYSNTRIVGDYRNGNLYELSSDVYTDNDNPLVKLRASPHVSNDLNRIIFDSFELDMETGVGVDGSGQGLVPEAMLQFSDDGGHTWSNEKWTSVGSIGQTKARAKWNRLGHSRSRVFRVSISDPVKTIFVGAEIAVRPAAS